MRLTLEEKNGIILAIAPFLEGHKAELRLYGSRVIDSLKGGDIDLLLLTEGAEIASKLTSNKHYLLSAIKKNLGDQKIDLLISSNKLLEQASFLQLIYPGSLILKQWG